MSDEDRHDARRADGRERVEALERDFGAIRTGRAATALVERIPVEYYGTTTPLNQLASHQRARGTLDRDPAVGPQRARRDREGDPQERGLGLTPNVDGTVVRLNIPPLTEERRKDLVKLVHKRMEEARVEIRNHRREVPTRSRRPSAMATSAPTRGAASWSAPEGDRPLDGRGRPRRQAQGTGDPRGRMTPSISLARPTSGSDRHRR